MKVKVEVVVGKIPMTLELDPEKGIPDDREGFLGYTYFLDKSHKPTQFYGTWEEAKTNCPEGWFVASAWER